MSKVVKYIYYCPACEKPDIDDKMEGDEVTCKCGCIWEVNRSKSGIATLFIDEGMGHNPRIFGRVYDDNTWSS